MFYGTLRYCSHMRCLSPVTATINTCLTDFATAFVNSRNYSQGKGDCCKDIAQTQGKRVEPWPKPDPPPPAWRLECPNEPQPPNYDPYRIKVPDVVCPPLPPSNAKELQNRDARELLQTSATNLGYNINPMLDLFRNTPIIHPDYFRQPEKRLSSRSNDIQESLPRLGYHGKNKYKYAFHEPWNPLDRLTLLSQAEKEELDQTGEASDTEKY